jgi:hypothetical protein
METSLIERRRWRRRPPEEGSWVAARLRTGHPLALINIGDGGVLVESSTRLLPGATVDLQLSGADLCLTRRAVVLRCSVIAVGEHAGVRYRGALAFVDSQPRVP